MFGINLFEHLLHVVTYFLVQICFQIQAAHYAYDVTTWELTDQYMFGSDIMVAPVLNPAGSDSSSRATPDARNGGKNGGLPVASVRVYIPANSNWVHLWTGQEVRGDQGRYVAVDAPIGYPPVFYLPTSIAGLKLREFVLKNGYGAGVALSLLPFPLPVTTTTTDSSVTTARTSTAAVSSSTKQRSHTSHPHSELSDNFTSLHPTSKGDSHSHSHGHHHILASKKYNFEAVIGEIADYITPGWAEWLGISQYVSKWDSTYYAIPIATSSGSSSGDGLMTSTGAAAAIEWVSSTHSSFSSSSAPVPPSPSSSYSATNLFGIKGLGSPSIIDPGNVNSNGNSNMMFQDIDVDLSSLFQ